MSTHTCPHCRGPLQLTLSGRSPYRDTYDQARALDAELQAGRPAPLSDGHMHARAMRKVSKAILRDLWAEARKGQAGA